jgi:hypothetical protein
MTVTQEAFYSNSIHNRHRQTLEEDLEGQDSGKRRIQGVASPEGDRR